MTRPTPAALLRVALLLSTVVSVNAAYTVLIPFVPELQHRIGASPLVVGLAFTLFAAGKLVAQPVGGLWVDRYGPRAVAVMALLIVAAGTAVTALADNSEVLLLGRAVWGLGEGVLTPALYAGMTHLCQRDGWSTVRVMGQFGAAAVAGFLIGPLVTGLASGLGFRTLFLLGAGVTVLSALMIAWALRGAGNVEVAEPAPENESGGGSRWWVGVLMFGSLDLVTNVTYSALEPVLPLYLAAYAPDARAAISLVFVLGLAMFGVIVWLIGRVGERVGLTQLVRVGLLCSAIGVAALATSAWLPVVAACFALIMVGQSALYLAARRGVIELRAGLAGHGRAFGLFGATSDVGNMIGPTVGVALWGWTGHTAFLVLAVPSAVLLVVMLGLATRRTTVTVGVSA